MSRFETHMLSRRFFFPRLQAFHGLFARCCLTCRHRIWWVALSTRIRGHNACTYHQLSSLQFSPLSRSSRHCSIASLSKHRGASEHELCRSSCSFLSPINCKFRRGLEGFQEEIRWVGSFEGLLQRGSATFLSILLVSLLGRQQACTFLEHRC